MTILYFIIVFCMCITRFNIIMTLVSGPLTRIDAVNMIPFHSITVLVVVLVAAVVLILLDLIFGGAIHLMIGA